METAKVDIKKLQVLSDRINQCIDALNQVRLSVHGLAQSNPFTPGQGFGAQQGLGQPGIGGLSHTSGNPFPTMGGINPYANPYAGFGGGIGALGLGGAQGQFPGQTGQIPGASPFFGLSHTGPEATEAYRSTWNDPYLAAKVTQTFPYLQFAVPPVVSLY